METIPIFKNQGVRMDVSLIAKKEEYF